MIGLHERVTGKEQMSTGLRHLINPNLMLNVCNEPAILSLLYCDTVSRREKNNLDRVAEFMTATRSLTAIVQLVQYSWDYLGMFGIDAEFSSTRSGGTAFMGLSPELIDLSSLPQDQRPDAALHNVTVNKWLLSRAGMVLRYAELFAAYPSFSY